MRRNEGCWSTKYLREDRVEATAIQRLGEIEDPKGKVLAKLKNSLQIVRPQDVGMYRQKMISELNAKIRRMQLMEENLYDDRLAGFISKEKYEEKRQQLAEQTAEVSERITMLREAQDAEDELIEVPQSDNPIVDLYLRSTPNQKRILLAVLFKKISVKNGVLKFSLYA